MFGKKKFGFPPITAMAIMGIWFRYIQKHKSIGRKERQILYKLVDGKI